MSELNVNKPTPWQRIVLIGLLCVGLLGLGVAWLTRPDSNNGLVATAYHFTDFTGELYSERQLVAVVSRNDVNLYYDQPFSIMWQGYYYAPQAGDVQFVVPKQMPARLRIGEQEVFDTLTAPHSTSTAEITLTAGYHQLEFAAVQPEASSAGYQAALQWATPFGGVLVPAGYLHTEQPSRPPPAPWLHSIAKLVVWFSVIGLAIGLGLPLLLRLPRRDLAVLMSLVVLALTLRLIYLNDLRTAFPNFDSLPLGSDHQGYANDMLQMLRGQWPPPGAIRVQPGYQLLMAQVQGWFGPSMLPIQALQAVTGALTVLAVFALGRKLFGAGAGWVAAGLWAIYPVAIFYDGQILTHVYEMQVMVWLALLWFVTLERIRKGQTSWGLLAATGVLLGASAVVRPTWVLFAPFLALSVLWAGWPNLKMGLLRGAALVVLVCAPIMPFTAYNISQGHFELISGNAGPVLYIGNNRTASGLGEFSPSFYATHRLVNLGLTDWDSQIQSEIDAEPGRWLGLMVRKTALYVGNPELPNNVDFYSEGAAISGLLRSIPLSYGGLVAVGLAGLILAVAAGGRQRWGAGFVGLLLLVQGLPILFFIVFSRFRTPTYGLWMVLAGVGLVLLAERLRQPGWRPTAVGAAVLIGMGMLVSSLPWVAERTIAKPIVAQVPDSALLVNAELAPGLRLLAQSPLEPVNDSWPIFMTLYWQADSALPPDTYVSVQLFAQNGDKLTQHDQPLGTGNGYPIHPAFEWQAGQIVADPVLLFLPADATQRTGMQAGLNALVIVYARDSETRYGEIWLPGPALTTLPPPAVPASANPVNAQVGSAQLLAYDVVQADGQMTLTLYWQATAPIESSATVFVHLLAANGDYVAGQDGPPTGGVYPTRYWQVGEGVTDSHTLTLTDLLAGEYWVTVGLYDPLTDSRWPVTLADGSQPATQAVPLTTISWP